MLCRPEVRDLPEAGGYAVVEAGHAAPAPGRLDDTVGLVITDIRRPGPMDASDRRPGLPENVGPGTRAG